MKKNYYLSLCAILFSFFASYSQCNDLFISEYVEGSSNNKYIEIYNPTGAAITLTGNYDLQLFFNGNAIAGQTISLNGSVPSQGVFVIENTSEALGVTANQQSGFLTFNGDDAVALRNSGIIIDVVGQIGFDPGTEWTGTTCTQGTADGTLRRNIGIQSGDNNGNDVFNPDTEWTCFNQNDVSDLGSHSSSCAATNEIQLQYPIATDVACGFNLDFGTQSIGTNNDSVFRIRNAGTIDLTITGLSFSNGTNFSLVGAPIPNFTIAAGNFIDITIRFIPTALGTINDVLTINNDDTNESICTINLSGIGNTICNTTTEIIAAQDFESNPSDTWNYTAVHAPITNYWYVATSVGTIPSAQSNANFWGITDLERAGHIGETHILTFDTVNISIYNNVELSFYYYADGVDSSDAFEYELIYDGTPQGRVDISADTGGWSNVSIGIPNTVSDVQIVFYPDLDAGPGFDQAGIDNLTLSHTFVDTATWNGTNWIWNDGTAIDTMPTTNAGVIIDGNYSTAVGGVQTSFEACECTVNTGSTLTIENNTYVLVENDLTVDGTIILKTDGSFVQTNDTATVNGDVLTDKTKISVEKETAPLASPLEYTYWSSPVVGELISEGLFEANTNRIFSFNGQNFRDSTQETNNDGATVLGQDDIDDDANDWQFVNGTTIMSPGVGYASTHSPLGFIGPSQYIYTFEGPFNNGVYNIPIYRNDIELNDNNWNFIGNPYPSAIDADLFLAANASIDQTVGATNGAIFLWSHNTAADGNTNGNENLNYAQSDYAIINGSGQTAGGDGVVPTRYIPSGQGFFVSMDDTAAASVHSGTIMTTNIVFNNSMRVTGSNNQFFRTAQYNKLWINLTSDNGIFNQVLIAYVDGATDGDDGMYYDAHKNLSSDLYSGLYTTMDSAVDKKFAIQGKDPNSLNIDEVIPLGFNTTIEEATVYTISIHTTEGNFMDENDIFIIDYDLNIIHNLKTSNYNFTSNSGEFNNRFEIVFTPEALSVNDNTITANDIIITELNNGEVQITVSEQYAIQHVEILDVLGRQVYSLNGNGSTEVYDLSKLSKAAYIAKVTLANGQVISKKAIKQR